MLDVHCMNTARRFLMANSSSIPALTLLVCLSTARVSYREEALLVSSIVHNERLEDEELADGREPAPPPEADLIRRHREATVPPLSRRQAAARAGISPSQWSDVERGSKRAGPGIVIPVQATAETLAKMATAVSVGADELAAAGRDDAAAQLRSASRQQALGQRLAAIPGLGFLTGQLRPEAVARSDLLPLIASGLDAIDASKLSTRTKNEITAVFIDNLRHDATRRHNELLLLLRLAEDATAAGRSRPARQQPDT
jgi:transcriptional regulator with XRE-family HTH domain